MSRINLFPDPAAVLKWGPLAYVSDAEREEILALPPAFRALRIRLVERELKEARKRTRHG